jgi:hypothetical protein
MYTHNNRRAVGGNVFCWICPKAEAELELSGVEKLKKHFGVTAWVRG